MKISLNALKKYVNITVPTDELLKLIGSRLVEIEGAEDLAPKYVGIKIVKVVDCEPIEGTHLHLCHVDAGQNDLIQIVCGAPNVHAGMLAAWIMPGAVVPATYGGENFRLDVRKLRGYESHGMLAAADELGFGSDHEGIIEIDPAIAHPGDNFADVFDLNDIILDIENKSLTHRPDCFGLIGFARELSGILGTAFAWAGDAAWGENAAAGPAQLLDVAISDPVLCPRYSCAIFDLPASYLKKSQYFTPQDVFLYKSDMRPVDPIVDLTNVLMLETGQPLHAFDYDKFVAVGGTNSPKIIVRAAEPGEKIALLDGKTIECAAHDILITSNNHPVALAGAMGGANTEIDAATKRVILESATFSLYNLRKTQMAHGIFSEALTRFTKGQPAGLTLPVLNEAISRLGVTPSAIVDAYPVPQSPEVITVAVADVNALLGTNYPAELMAKTLFNVGLVATLSADTSVMRVEVPFWRTDLHIKEDIIEEVGRLLGYDNIPLDFPKRPFIGAELNPEFTLKTTLRNLLSDRFACHEVLTYSFVSQDLQQKVGENPAESYQIVNSISPELQCFRQSVIPSLLDKIRDNQKAGFSDFALYEINQVAAKTDGLNDENVPITKTHLGLVVLGDYYHAKNLLESLCARLGLSLELSAAKPEKSYFEPLHSAVFTLSGQPFASCGEIKTSVLKKFKLDAPISAFEFDLSPLVAQGATIKATAPALSKFPSVTRDFTFKTPDDISFAALETAVRDAISPELIFSLSATSIFCPDAAAARNISFRLTFSHPQKTLNSAEISAIMESVISHAKTLGVEVV